MTKQSEFLKSFAAATVVLGMCAGFATAAQAQGESGFKLPGSFSANVAIANDYVFRGISQTDEEFAIQGGFDWDSSQGFYIGTWASNVDFNDGDEASVEIDVYGGYAGSIGNFEYDIGVIYYIYPGADESLDYNFWEVALNVGYDFGVASWSGGIFYTPNNFGDTDEGIYLTTGVAVPVVENLEFSVNGSYYEVDPSFGDDYYTWDVGLTYSFEWFDIDARYYDTDIDACDICDARAVVAVSKSF